ncbi:hypothetical protein HZS_7076 [Henneguya salminicola]|nr:hypothetical protein HZS_7076 [Henneguya salminicola]
MNLGPTFHKLDLSDSTLHFRMFPWLKVLKLSTELTMRWSDTKDHPNLYAFVEVIKKEFEYYQERCTERRQNVLEIIYRQPQNTQNQQLDKFQSFINRGNN